MRDRERENYKSKLREREAKSSKTEAKQTQLLLSFEQERAKYETEKNFLIGQKEDAMEQAQRLEKKVENLIRENGKLQTQIKSNKRNAYQAMQNTTTYTAGIVGTKFLNQIQEKMGGGDSNTSGIGSAIQGLHNLSGLKTNDGGSET